MGSAWRAGGRHACGSAPHRASAASSSVVGRSGTRQLERRRPADGAVRQCDERATVRSVPRSAVGVRLSRARELGRLRARAAGLAPVYDGPSPRNATHRKPDWLGVLRRLTHTEGGSERVARCGSGARRSEWRGFAHCSAHATLRLRAPTPRSGPSCARLIAVELARARRTSSTFEGLRRTVDGRACGRKATHARAPCQSGHARARAARGEGRASAPFAQLRLKPVTEPT